MRASRSTVLLVVGIMAMVLGGASLAFACGGQPTLGLSSNSGPAGSPLTLTGALFPADAKVNVYWGGEGGVLVGTGTGPSFSIDTTVPANAAAGVHYVVATTGGTQASRPFRVASASASTAPAEEPAGERAQSDMPLSAATPAVAPAEEPAPAAPAAPAAAAPAAAPARTAAASRPAPVRAPAANPVAAPAPAAVISPTPGPTPQAALPSAAPAPAVLAPSAPAGAPADRWNGVRAGSEKQPSRSMADSSSQSQAGQWLAFALLAIGGLLLIGFGAAVLAGDRSPAQKRTAALRRLPTDRH